jgi:anti-anti-sigma factor
MALSDPWFSPRRADADDATVRRRFQRAVHAEVAHLTRPRGMPGPADSSGVARDPRSEASVAVAAHRGAGSKQLVIRTAFQNGTFIIALYGEMDLVNVEQVHRALARAEATSAAEIVVDLGGLQFMDSTGVHLLIEAHARSRLDGNRLSLLGGSPAVQRVIDVCGLADRLPFVG